MRNSTDEKYVVKLRTYYMSDYLVYCTNVNQLHLCGLSIYFATILSLRMVLKENTLFFFERQFVPAIFMLHIYGVISAGDISRFLRKPEATV